MIKKNSRDFKIYIYIEQYYIFSQKNADKLYRLQENIPPLTSIFKNFAFHRFLFYHFLVIFDTIPSSIRKNFNSIQV